MKFIVKMYSVRQEGMGINQNSSELKQQRQQRQWKLNRKSELICAVSNFITLIQTLLICQMIFSGVEL